jgi:hypothetical protein
MRARHRAALLLGAAVGLCADARAAQTDAGAPPPPPPGGAQTQPNVTPPPPETATVVTENAPGARDWPARFAEARQALLDGEWDRAASELDALAASAPTAEDVRAARELASLARYWKARDLAFVPRQSLGESSLSSKAVGRRTIDELVTLYATGAAYGAGVGLSLASLLDAKDVAAFIVPAIVGAGTGIGGVALVDTFGRLRYGQAQAVASGTLLGLGEALLVDFWHLAWEQQSCAGCARQKWDGKAYVGIGLAMTTAGAALGGVFGTLLPMTPGRASWVSSMGIWTGALVACVSGAIAADSIKQDVLIPTMVGYNLGIAGGIFTAGLVSPSIARVRLLDLGGIVGGLSAMGLYFAAVNNGTADANAALGVTGLGIAAGLTTSWLLTMRMTPDRPNAAGDQAQKKSSWDVHPMLGPLPGGATAGFAGTF